MEELQTKLQEERIVENQTAYSFKRMKAKMDPLVYAINVDNEDESFSFGSEVDAI